jgi:hypothetical protein
VAIKASLAKHEWLVALSNAKTPTTSGKHFSKIGIALFSIYEDNL